MSNTTNNPLRVADLSDTVYIPRVPTRKQTSPPPAFTEPQEPSSSLDDKHQVDNVGSQVNPAADFAKAKSENSGQVSLSELRTKFASEQSQGTLLAAQQQEAPSAGSQILSGPPSVPSVDQGRQVSGVNLEEAIKVTNTAIGSTASSSPHEKVSVWGLDYHAVTMSQAIDYLDQIISKGEPSFAVTANLNYGMLCSKHPRLLEFTKRAALVLCDGMPIFWRSKLGSKALPERVAGSDLIYKLSERCAAKKYRIYFYGAAEGVAEAAASRLQQLYPGLEVAGVQCPPFHDSSSTAIQDQVARIKKARPDVLLVALGQPKGEYWIEDHLKELGVPLAIQLGASFDFVAGQAKRAPRWMQRTGLEWLYRASKDPRRLIPRYWSNFVYLVSSVRREMIEGLS